jgi:hypothetical protein
MAGTWVAEADGAEHQSTSPGLGCLSDDMISPHHSHDPGRKRGHCPNLQPSGSSGSPTTHQGGILGAKPPQAFLTLSPNCQKVTLLLGSSWGPKWPQAVLESGLWEAASANHWAQAQHWFLLAHLHLSCLVLTSWHTIFHLGAVPSALKGNIL